MYGYKGTIAKGVGSQKPFFSERIKQEISSQIKEALLTAAIAPQAREVKSKPRWTLKRLAQWIEKKWGIGFSESN